MSGGRNYHYSGFGNVSSAQNRVHPYYTPRRDSKRFLHVKNKQFKKKLKDLFVLDLLEVLEGITVQTKYLLRATDHPFRCHHVGYFDTVKN